MSTDNGKSTQPDGDKQLEVLFNKVFVPRFVTKCAELGLPLQTEQDVKRALHIGSMIGQAKAASAAHMTPALLEQGERGLRQHMKQAGLTVPEEEPSVEVPGVDDAVRAAASALVGRNDG